MPTPAPTSTAGTLTQLQALGERLRSRRLQLAVSGKAAAAAGVSRVTLHRIEKGEPSVTMGAYLNVMEALGLALLVGADATPVMTGPEAGPLERSVRPEATEPQAAPNEIPLASYPELRRLAWQVAGAQTLTAQEALAVYERNWRHLDTAALQASERWCCAMESTGHIGNRWTWVSRSRTAPATAACASGSPDPTGCRRSLGGAAGSRRCARSVPTNTASAR